MKTIAKDIKIGDVIKSPFSPFWGKVIEITFTDKKITFHVDFVIHTDKSQIGKRWGYTFFKTTKIVTK
ncbi:MAG: hypothetical protein M0P71_13190 [Melioribacteraceae bacterium]|jgi:hypothetical protein|nr:hypothetical protein [Melioribacteraceae bacterium]